MANRVNKKSNKFVFCLSFLILGIFLILLGVYLAAMKYHSQKCSAVMLNINNACYNTQFNEVSLSISAREEKSLLKGISFEVLYEGIIKKFSISEGSVSVNAKICGRDYSSLITNKDIPIIGAKKYCLHLSTPLSDLHNSQVFIAPILNSQEYNSCNLNTRFNLTAC